MYIYIHILYLSIHIYHILSHVVFTCGTFPCTFSSGAIQAMMSKLLGRLEKLARQPKVMIHGVT